MTELSFEATSATPQITLDKHSGKFILKGKSFPEESRSFYAPLFTWLEEYSENPNEETLFEFKMEYFNSSSSLIILELLNLLDSIHKDGMHVTISWSYLDIDEDMLEAGEEYADLVSLPFEYHPLTESEF